MIPQTQINPPSAKIVFQSEARRRESARRKILEFWDKHKQQASACRPCDKNILEVDELGERALHKKLQSKTQKE